MFSGYHFAALASRALHGRVDGNQCISYTHHAPPVAPFTGAWIETVYGVQDSDGDVVAPFTGAWIETCNLVGGEA